MSIEAELRRRLLGGTLVDWVLRDAGGDDDLPTDPVSDLGVRAKLQELLDVIDEGLPTRSPSRENRLDYDTRTDANPVYVGDAAPGAATSALAWTVLKLHYDSDNRLTRKQVQVDIAWDNRTAGW